ncbi:MAG: 3-deoxy-7-phosphoheptulonate synthase [Gammaproteobacteria bacterium]|nr:3-deoxy-7-phosphoheptulonate synthase [Gammaproteobacteria bacterium]
MKTDNVRIVKARPLLTPAILHEEIPLNPETAGLIHASRRTVEAILDGDDRRIMVVVGPCSVHDPQAALAYAERLQLLAEELSSALFIVMRVYFEKPRTRLGWKGLINDPNLDGSFQINKGLRLARQLLSDISAIGLPAGTEFLDTTFGQFYTDHIGWGAIGARTAESQIHRELASGLSMPVGIKNRTDGNMQVAVDAILAARSPHLFPSLTEQGAPAILETSGNPYCHLVLRGGTVTGPNYHASSVDAALDLLHAVELPKVLMVDCSHGNSESDPSRQIDVVQSIIRQRRKGQRAIRAVMLESHLVAGRQNVKDVPLTFGQSITDACLGYDDTADVLRDLAAAVN